jgi:hypothetical protein
MPEITREGLSALLGSMGSTAEEVAETIRDAGVTGTTGHVFNCPVARWLAHKVGVRASVGLSHAAAYPLEADVVRTHLLPPVVDFVARYDGRGDVEREFTFLDEVRPDATEA